MNLIKIQKGTRFAEKVNHSMIHFFSACQKTYSNAPDSCIIEETGVLCMEKWGKDARREAVIVDLDMLVPKDHLLRKIEKVMDYDWLY